MKVVLTLLLQHTVALTGPRTGGGLPRPSAAAGLGPDPVPARRSVTGSSSASSKKNGERFLSWNGIRVQWMAVGSRSAVIEGERNVLFQPAQRMSTGQLRHRGGNEGHPGLVAGEATSATLRAMADCLGAMAYMVDTGGESVATLGGRWRIARGQPNPMAKAAPQEGYDKIFDSSRRPPGESLRGPQVPGTPEYARSALAEGRGGASSGCSTAWVLSFDAVCRAE
jgi:hypothetical protein